MASRHDGHHDTGTCRQHRTAAKHDQPEEDDHSVDVVDEGDWSGQQTPETSFRHYGHHTVGEREDEGEISQREMGQGKRWVVSAVVPKTAQTFRATTRCLAPR